jgi:hypothetical protein
MNSEIFFKPPVTFPTGPSDVNEKNSLDFAKARYLGLFWGDDLLRKPVDKNEGLGKWARCPLNARQAVAIDFESCEALLVPTNRSTLTLHSLVTWFNADKGLATKVMETVLAPQSFGHLRILMRYLYF